MVKRDEHPFTGRGFEEKQGRRKLKPRSSQGVNFRSRKSTPKWVLWRCTNSVVWCDLAVSCSQIFIEKIKTVVDRYLLENEYLDEINGIQTSDFRDIIFKQDCRKSKAILVGLPSCRWEICGIKSRKVREKKKIKDKKKTKKKKKRKKQIKMGWRWLIL